MAKIRRMSSAVLLCCISFVALILLAPAAAAANIHAGSPAVAPTSTAHPGPVALASTGLDITMPVIIGLGTLIVGIMLVAWAFLRTGPAEHR
jgi:hypothetical protein